MLSTRYWESLVLVSLFIVSIWITFCELNSFFFHSVSVWVCLLTFVRMYHIFKFVVILG